MGELGEDGRQAIEQRLLAQPDFLDEVLIAEVELIDSYVNGSLAGRESESFERNFLLTPERRRKLKFARALKKYADEAEPAAADAADLPAPTPPRRWPFGFLQSRPAFAYAAAASLLLCAALGVWYLLVVLPQQQRRAALLSELAELNRPAAGGGAEAPSAAAVFTLSAGLVREGGGLSKVTVGPGVRVVRLRLSVADDEFESYQGVLQAEGEEEPVRVGGLGASGEAGGRVVVLNLPSDLLAEGDQRLRLSGVTETGAVEPVATYAFRVERVPSR